MRLRIPAPFDQDWAHKGGQRDRRRARRGLLRLAMPNTPPATINPDALAHGPAFATRTL